MRNKSLDKFKAAVQDSVRSFHNDVAQAVIDELSKEEEFEPSLSINSDGIYAVWLAGECFKETSWDELINEFVEDADLQEYEWIKKVASELRRVADEIEKRCK